MPAPAQDVTALAVKCSDNRTAMDSNQLLWGRSVVAGCLLDLLVFSSLLWRFRLFQTSPVARSRIQNAQDPIVPDFLGHSTHRIPFKFPQTSAELASRFLLLEPSVTPWGKASQAVQKSHHQTTHNHASNPHAKHAETCFKRVCSFL